MKFSAVTLLAIFVWTTYKWQVYAYQEDVFISLKSFEKVWRQTSKADFRNGELTCDRPDTYTCELPPEIISPEATKMCNYRNVRYHEQVYRWVAGRGCLLYTPDFLFVAGANTINLSAACQYGNLFAPCLEIEKEDGTCGCFPFDPAFDEVVQAVELALVTSARGRFERCFYAAEECCDLYTDERPSIGGENATGCEATFDGWSCFAGAEVSTTSQEVCPEFAYSNAGPSCNHYSNKQCNADGTWEVQTDYSSCSITPRLLRRYRFYISMLAISTATCLPAVFIFFFYKRLRVTRVNLHRNLLIAIIARNVVVMISRREIYIDELTSTGDTAMSAHSILCRVLAVAERAAGNAVFVCMLLEGVYLHRMIVAVFRKKTSIGVLYAVGALIAIIPVVAWAAVMGVHNDHSCWLVYTVDHIQWIIDAPRVAILLVNTVLFVDVTRVLVTKIRNSENVNQLNTTKATLFLMPLFGSQFLLTVLRPSTDNCTGEEVYYYITYTVEGLQGFIVAMLYCYINKEVQSLIKATYMNIEAAIMRTRRDTKYRRTTSGVSTTRTYSTGFDTEDQRYSTAQPKVYVAQVIETPERLAEVLEPEYANVRNVYGVHNKGFEARDSGLQIKDTDEGPSSKESHHWARNISSPSSSHENSLSDEEQYPDKFTNDDKNSNDDELKVHEMDEVNETVKMEDDESIVNDMIKEFENREVLLIPELLSPNRRDNEKIVFVDE